MPKIKKVLIAAGAFALAAYPFRRRAKEKIAEATTPHREAWRAFWGKLIEERAQQRAAEAAARDGADQP